MHRCLLFAVLVYAMRLAGEDGRVTVKSESAEVHTEMSESSAVVKTLQRGESVTIEFSIAASEGAWCEVGLDGTPGRGWVRCDKLSSVESSSKQDWRPAVAAARPKPAEGPYLKWAKKACPEFDEWQLNQGWPLVQVAPSLEMEQCLAGERGRRLKRAEIRQWQADAERSGAQTCWVRYLEIREKYRPDGTTSARDAALAAFGEWKLHACSRVVEAFRLRMMAGPVSTR